jgi:hypothetical protein
MSPTAPVSVFPSGVSGRTRPTTAARNSTGSLREVSWEDARKSFSCVAPEETRSSIATVLVVDVVTSQKPP